jgi:D-inositol-3-phosphate glycosyltransferase
MVIRILMWSDGGCNTGFGTVTHNLATRWCAMGHEVHIIAINYRGDEWDVPYKLYAPPPGDVYAYKELRGMIDYVQPDVFFVLNDLDVILNGWVMLDCKWPIPTVIYTPIDGVNLPREWFLPARQANTVVAMSKFGQCVFRDEGNIDAHVIYHGVEHDIFRRFMSRDKAKQAIGLDGRFVVLAINRNSFRKNYYDTFRVFSEFHKRHEDAFLLIHAVRNDVGGNLNILIEKYGLHDCVRISDPGETFIGLPKSTLALYYNAADIKISTSIGEGFGLTDAEAIACGTPVVAQDFSATSEVVGPGGILVKPERHLTTERMMDFALPDVDGFVEALERLYQDVALRELLGNQGMAHARQFDWDVAAREFVGLMEHINS